MTRNNNGEARNWAMLCHLSSILWLPIAIVLGVLGIPLPIPLLNILGPLVVWLSKKNQHPLIDAHGKESLNFQISFTIYGGIAAIVFLFLVAVTCGVGFSSSSSTTASPLWQIGLVLGVGGFALFLIIGIVQLALVIVAAIRAKKGEFYHYPYTIRFLR
jgi:hypothetical protein